MDKVRVLVRVAIALMMTANAETNRSRDAKRLLLHPSPGSQSSCCCVLTLFPGCELRKRYLKCPGSEWVRREDGDAASKCSPRSLFNKHVHLHRRFVAYFLLSVRASQSRQAGAGSSTRSSFAFPTVACTSFTAFRSRSTRTSLTPTASSPSTSTLRVCATVTLSCTVCARFLRLRLLMTRSKTQRPARLKSTRTETVIAMMPAWDSCEDGEFPGSACDCEADGEASAAGEVGSGCEGAPVSAVSYPLVSSCNALLRRTRTVVQEQHLVGHIRGCSLSYLVNVPYIPYAALFIMSNAIQSRRFKSLSRSLPDGSILVSRAQLSNILLVSHPPPRHLLYHPSKPSYGLSTRENSISPAITLAGSLGSFDNLGALMYLNDIGDGKRGRHTVAVHEMMRTVMLHRTWVIRLALVVCVRWVGDRVFARARSVI